MARARVVKPTFFTNEDLAELPIEARLLFIGLWTIADRKGRLEDRPKRIRAEVFPYDNIDAEPLLAALHDGRFILRYKVDGLPFILIPAFLKHQRPHVREAPSKIPAPEGMDEPEEDDAETEEGLPKAAPRHDLGSEKEVQGRTKVAGIRYTVTGNRYAVTGDGDPVSSEVIALAAPGTRRKKAEKPEIISLTDAEIDQLAEKYADLPEVRDKIALALEHPAHLKYPKGQFRYVNNWLSTERARLPQRSNGNGRNNPDSPARTPVASEFAAYR